LKAKLYTGEHIAAVLKEEEAEARAEGLPWSLETEQQDG
jgi:hypothetical protein